MSSPDQDLQEENSPVSHHHHHHHHHDLAQASDSEFNDTDNESSRSPSLVRSSMVKEVIEDVEKDDVIIKPAAVSAEPQPEKDLVVEDASPSSSFVITATEPDGSLVQPATSLTNNQPHRYSPSSSESSPRIISKSISPDILHSPSSAPDRNTIRVPTLNLAGLTPPMPIIPTPSPDVNIEFEDDVIIPSEPRALECLPIEDEHRATAPLANILLTNETSSSSSSASNPETITDPESSANCKPEISTSQQDTMVLQDFNTNPETIEWPNPEDDEQKLPPFPPFRLAQTPPASASRPGSVHSTPDQKPSTPDQSKNNATISSGRSAFSSVSSTPRDEALNSTRSSSANYGSRHSSISSGPNSARSLSQSHSWSSLFQLSSPTHSAVTINSSS
jgi:hypothetical protein